jgi:alpha-methylacyl-CoA racemase
MNLDSVRVLDLTRLLPGPYGTQQLTDLGAKVIKIEDTDTGDYARHMAGGNIFNAINWGKRSIALDLKTDAGREAFYRLVADVDVVIESFRPGVVSRLGIDYDTLREYNPEIVYCSISAFGQTGPNADRAGHDLNVAGVAGLLDMTREHSEAKPPLPGYQIADMATGLFAAFSITSALLARELGSGDGEYIDVAMADITLSFGQSLAGPAFSSNDPRPGETPLTGSLPWYDIYETADGQYVVLAALERPFWESFCEEINREELIDVHDSEDSTVREVLREELTAVFTERTRDDWERDLGNRDTTVSGIYTLSEALENPQTEARGIIERSGETPRIGFPAITDRPETDETLPDLGEHTDEILNAAGYSNEKIESLRTRGVIR